MINYKFNRGLVSTYALLKNLSVPEGTLDYWKWKWKKDGNNTYDMGLRIMGKRALWDPVQFLKWAYKHKLKNKPTTPEEEIDQKNLIAFITRNVNIK